MHILMVYDVKVKRVTKVLKIGRKYLQHIQTSVLEGELSPAQFKSLRNEIKKTIKPEEDCVRFYLLRTTQYLTIDQLGTPQKPAANPETSVDFL